MSPVPVLSTTTSSVALSQPDSRSCPTAAKQAAPSGQINVPSSRGQRRLRRQQLVVGDGDRGAAGGAHGVEHQEVAERLRHGDPERDRARVGRAADSVGARVERLDDRRAARGLHRDEPRQVAG